MQVVEHPSVTGLLVAEDSVGEREVQRILRDYDPRLRLVPQRDEASQGLLWQVYYWNGPDQAASYVCSWMDRDGVPLPLSSRILDKVQQQDVRTVGLPEDVNVLNARHRERVKLQQEQRLQDVADDHRPYIDRGRRSVSMGTRTTRQPADHI